MRQAISCAINRGDIVKGVLLGLGEPAFGPYKPGTWAYHPGLRPVSFNPDRARKLLAEAGFADSDGDGMPDAWELARGLDPSDPADGAAKSLSEAYTNVEIYLHECAAALLREKRINEK